MIEEMRIYTLKVGALPAYLEIFERIALPIMRQLLTLRGFWTVDCGDLNEFYHLCSFDDHEHRLRSRAALAAHPEWPGFRNQVLDLVLSQRNIILSPRFQPSKDQTP